VGWREAEQNEGGKDALLCGLRRITSRRLPEAGWKIVALSLLRELIGDHGGG